MKSSYFSKAGSYKYTANIQHPSSFLCPRPNFLFPFKKILGGTNKNVWHHAHSKHPSEVDEFGVKPQNQREAMLGDGTSAKCYSFDDESLFEQNKLLLKHHQKKGLNLFKGKDGDLRHFSTSMD
jgi:hypothetical protein